MNPGKRGGQPGVSFIADQSQGPGFGNGQIGAADAHVRGQKGRTEFFSGHLDHAVDVLQVNRRFRDLAEKGSHLLPGKVNGRHDHVGRAFLPQLNDPFPEIGFGHFETLCFQMIIQMGLFRGHGFGFDNGLNADCPCRFSR